MKILSQQVTAVPAEIGLYLQSIGTTTTSTSDGASRSDRNIESNLTPSAISVQREHWARRLNRGSKFSISLPFRQRIWQMTAIRSFGGWSVHLETHNVRRFDTVTLMALEGDDLLGLRKQIASGQATPYDRSPEGESLLLVSRLGEQDTSAFDGKC